MNSYYVIDDNDNTSRKNGTVKMKKVEMERKK